MQRGNGVHSGESGRLVGWQAKIEDGSAAVHEISTDTVTKCTPNCHLRWSMGGRWVVVRGLCLALLGLSVYRQSS